MPVSPFSAMTTIFSIEWEERQGSRAGEGGKGEEGGPGGEGKGEGAGKTAKITGINYTEV